MSIPIDPAQVVEILTELGIELTVPPIETALDIPFISRADRTAELQGALRGVELGAYDQVVIAWLADWDTAVVVTLASLIERARSVRAVDLYVLGYEAGYVAGQPGERP